MSSRVGIPRRGSRFWIRVFAVRDTVLHAEWTALKPKLMRRGEIMVSGYIAVHTQYAIEEDFKKIKEAGLDFVILDYVPGI